VATNHNWPETFNAIAATKDLALFDKAYSRLISFDFAACFSAFTENTVKMCVESKIRITPEEQLLSLVLAYTNVEKTRNDILPLIAYDKIPKSHLIPLLPSIKSYMPLDNYVALLENLTTDVPSQELVKYNSDTLQSPFLLEQQIISRLRLTKSFVLCFSTKTDGPKPSKYHTKCLALKEQLIIVHLNSTKTTARIVVFYVFMNNIPAPAKKCQAIAWRNISLARGVIFYDKGAMEDIVDVGTHFGSSRQRGIHIGQVEGKEHIVDITQGFSSLHMNHHSQRLKWPIVAMEVFKPKN